jgi:hypothetical protein
MTIRYLQPITHVMTKNATTKQPPPTTPSLRGRHDRSKPQQQSVVGRGEVAAVIASAVTEERHCERSDRRTSLRAQ